MTKITAGRGKLDARDFLRGLFVASISTTVPIISDSINAGNFNLNWKHIGLTALAGAVGYLVKNMLTPSQVIVTDPVQVEAAKQGETITVAPVK